MKQLHDLLRGKIKQVRLDLEFLSSLSCKVSLQWSDNNVILLLLACRWRLLTTL